MKENYLLIFKSSLDLVCYIDTIVKNQERYYKYSIGLELREVAKEILLLVGRANRVRGEKRVEKLELLVEQCEDFKTLLALELRADTKLKKHANGLDFLGYIIRENYILTRKRVVHNYKYKKAKYLEAYEAHRGEMRLEEIKQFLSVQASFVSHIKHSNSFNLTNKIGVLNESNPFDFDRA